MANKKTARKDKSQVIQHEIRTTAFAEKNPLPENDWNFFPKGSATPLHWQLNHWLNYEYARSSAKIVSAVAKLRCRQIKNREAGTLPHALNIPRFAAYLKKYYPEFPDTCWRKLPEEKRRRRYLERSGANLLSNPFEMDILKTYDPYIFAHHIATGEINLRPNTLPDEFFAVLEIDFKQHNKVIEKQFREWLPRRREELKQMFQGKKEANYIDASKQTITAGRRGNPNTYRSFLKQLAALRLMNHYKNDYISCAHHTYQISGEYLYAEEMTSWNRAKKDAQNLMERFEVAWNHHYYPPFILMPGQFSETIHVNTLGRPLRKPRK